jgi:acyl carrier protein
MIPSAFVVLESLPLNPNGKVDRQALPVPENALPTDQYVAPRTPVEEVLSTLWVEVLGVEQVGIHHDFFDLGGHSLLATQVISRIREMFQVELPLRRLFEVRTVAGMADVLVQHERIPGQIEKLARMHQKLNQMSEEEMQTLLQQKQQKKATVS